MKIAIDCRFVGRSGIGTYIENVLDELLKNHPEHEYLFIKETGADIGDIEGNMLLETDIKPFSLRELFCFPVADVNKCDVFFSPYINIPGGINIPIFSTIHDVVFLDFPELTSSIGKWVRRWYIARAIRKSKALFTVSEFSKHRIMTHFRTNKEIIVTYVAISASLKTYIRDNSTQEKKDFIIYVGNIKKNKGLKVLLKAFSKACDNGYSKDLYIVGDGDKIRTADNDFEEYVINNNRIKFTGFIPNEEMFGLIQRADALVLPTFYEGFGIPPLEALYLGTDVIISDIPVLKEVYGQLPVTFFSVGDDGDLKEKIIGNHKHIDDPAEVRKKIDGMYNFEVITNTILSNIIGPH